MGLQLLTLVNKSKSSLLTQNVRESEKVAKKFDGYRQEGLPMSLCSSFMWNESCTDCLTGTSQTVWETLFQMARNLDSIVGCDTEGTTQLPQCHWPLRLV